MPSPSHALISASIPAFFSASFTTLVSDSGSGNLRHITTGLASSGAQPSSIPQSSKAVPVVHSAQQQDERTMTGRIIKAMENPNVDMLAHPSGRLRPRKIQ